MKTAQGDKGGDEVLIQAFPTYLPVTFQTLQLLQSLSFAFSAQIPAGLACQAVAGAKYKTVVSPRGGDLP